MYRLIVHANFQMLDLPVWPWALPSRSRKTKKYAGASRPEKHARVLRILVAALSRYKTRGPTSVSDGGKPRQ
jgi:hypothetical protein